MANQSFVTLLKENIDVMRQSSSRKTTVEDRLEKLRYRYAKRRRSQRSSLEKGHEKNILRRMFASIGSFSRRVKQCITGEPDTGEVKQDVDNTESIKEQDRADSDKENSAFCESLLTMMCYKTHLRRFVDAETAKNYETEQREEEEASTTNPSNDSTTITIHL